MKQIHIVAGIIFNRDKSKVYITQRPSHLHKGGYWEFPGGKVEAGESVETAMARELDEEIGIIVTKQSQFEHLEYDYSDKSLEFDFIVVHDFEKEPYGKEGQLGLWVEVADLVKYTFPEANRPIMQRVIKEFT
ncbi:8-oxo-dGTP diphosphatase MutT [Vibrio kyushuensis]|uniref:8-oxo-dGTP diphosphatase MutT n=1 Tax=Vibrio kyushuensis TaxID=2910249 RepID=UPI003D0C7191